MYCARSNAAGSDSSSGSCCLELVDRFVFVCFHPFRASRVRSLECDRFRDATGLSKALLHRRRPLAFSVTSVARWMPLVAARSAPDTPVEHRDPTQRQAHRHRCAQQDVGRDLQSLQFDVWLIKTVEQHQCIGALAVSPPCDRAKFLKNGLSLTATGIFNCALIAARISKVSGLRSLPR